MALPCFSMDTKYREVGKRIKMLREDMGLNATEFLQRLHQETGHTIGNSTLSQHEKGQTRPGLDLTVSLAKALRTTTDYLLLATDDPSPPRNSEHYVILEPNTEERHRVLEDIAKLLEEMDAHDLYFSLDTLRRIFYARTGGVEDLPRDRTAEMSKLLQVIRDIGRDIGESDAVEKLIDEFDARAS